MHKGFTDGRYSSTPAGPRHRVSPRSIACPDCKAPEGTDCVRLDGSGPSGTMHKARRRMATRADNLARELGGTLEAGALEKGPTRIDEENGRVCTDCGLKIRTLASGALASHDSRGNIPSPRHGRSRCPGVPAAQPVKKHV